MGCPNSIPLKERPRSLCPQRRARRAAVRDHRREPDQDATATSPPSTASPSRSPPGESFGLLGPNGAGKSTTMRMIGGGLHAHRRRPEHPGPRPGRSTAPRSAPSWAWCRSRTTSTTNCKVRDNLIVYGRYFGLPRATCGPRPTSCSSSPSSTDKAKSKVDDLSGGMKRRLTIARAYQRAAHPAARRADHRPRPAGPAHPVGPAVPAQGAGHDAGAHHPLHGRGRAALRPARRGRQGPDHGGGLAGRAHPRVLDARGARGAVRLGTQRRASPPSSTASASGVEVLPDRILIYATTARPRSCRSPRAGCIRSPAWCAGRASRTCSCGSPAEPDRMSRHRGVRRRRTARRSARRGARQAAAALGAWYVAEHRSARDAVLRLDDPRVRRRQPAALPVRDGRRPRHPGRRQSGAAAVRRGQLPRLRRAGAAGHRGRHGRQRGVHLPDHARLQVEPRLLRHERLADRARRRSSTASSSPCTLRMLVLPVVIYYVFMLLFGAVPSRLGLA